MTPAKTRRSQKSKVMGFAALHPCYVLIATAIFGCVFGGRAQASETPLAFMQAVYANYPNPGFTPLDIIGYAPSLFSDSLLALIRPKDADLDPICDCQDTDGMRVGSIKITEQQNGSARALANLDFFGKPVVVKFKLVEQKNGWRIDDIDDPDMPSLRAYLSSPK